MKTLEQIVLIAQELIERDIRRNQDFEDYERMYHNDWNLPKELADKQWIMRVLNTEPASKVNAATRAIARLEPQIKVMPLYENEDSKEWANNLEMIFTWNLKMASRRRPATIWWDYAFSSLLYNMIAAQVIDLDYMIDKYELFGGNVNRLKAARRRGRFLVNVYNPKNVHYIDSTIMEEGVLLVQTKTIKQVVDDFGEMLTKNLRAQVSAEDDYYRSVILFDYWDYEQRCVWVQAGDALYPKQSDRILLMPPTENEFPFMPWVISGGASSIEKDEERKYRPLLYTVLKAKLWELANITDSLITSKTVALSGMPVLKEEGQLQSRTEIDYDDPLAIAEVTPGNSLNVMTPPPIDPRMIELRSYMTQKMSSILPDILVTLQPSQNEPYAGFSLRLATAIGVLAPFIKVTENALAETCVRMAEWAHYTRRGLQAFGSGKENEGRQYFVDWDQLEPESLFVEVNLRPDTPTDKIGNINAAAIAVNSLGMSQETALEQIGIENPQTEMRRRILERFIQAEIEARVQTRLTEVQQAIRQVEMQNQMELQEIQNLAKPQGIPGIEGQGFNPAAGGIPPAVVQPFATREGQEGTRLP